MKPEERLFRFFTARRLPVILKPNHNSFYYAGAAGAELPRFNCKDTALLVIDLQRCYLRQGEDGGAAEAARWEPFRKRLADKVLPKVQSLERRFRAAGSEVIFARIACQKNNGSDRSLSQRLPGFNDLLMPRDSEGSQIIDSVAPQGDEITVCKTTDSALTGTNLRLMLCNMGIKNVVVCGIFTDQCVASTVRSLADESFFVVIPEDACAAGTMELHDHELEILNHIYAQVGTCAEVLAWTREG
jgi:nicotinamidase-related amidase